MEKKSIVNVPFIAYEKEMGGKNKIIILMGIIILTLIISIVFICYMFTSFINSHDYRNYDQNGNGQNNINEGTQGDVINESTITEND